MQLIRLKSTIVSMAAVAVVIVLWGLASHYRLVTPLLMPSPLAILNTGITLSTEGYVDVPLWQHTLISVARAMAAFCVATIFGIPLGLYMGMSSSVNALLNPFIQFLRPVPKLALIPLVIVWFGIGEFSKFLLIFLATFLTVVVSGAAAVKNVKEGRIRVALTLGANQYQIFRRVMLPSALPELFVGVRMAIGIGWTTLIAAEMIASSSGLGYMVMNASSYLRTDVVIIGIFLLGTIGYALDVLLVLAQRRLVPWMGKE
jgi:taurine transport system permease protein